MSEVIDVSWEAFRTECSEMLKGKPKGFSKVYGIPTGGFFVAQELARQSEGSLTWIIESPSDPKKVWVVDDLVDSGATLRGWVEDGFIVDALYRKSTSPKHIAVDATTLDGWIKFPWEHDSSPTDAVTRLIEWVGEDPSREGLLDTPKRVTKAFKELCCGYDQDPKAILSKQFTVEHDELVVIKDIQYDSLCEHHMLPFFGTCAVGYIPKGKVVGASKIPRVINCFARRLQVQERLTDQIAKAIYNYVPCRGVGVIMTGQHMCMSSRGVEQKMSAMRTSSLLGVFRDDVMLRAEFISLCGL